MGSAAENAIQMVLARDTPLLIVEAGSMWSDLVMTQRLGEEREGLKKPTVVLHLELNMTASGVRRAVCACV